ncbi:MAG: hypothetical protein ACR2PG_11480 [Hyphomicrobiaceae bacterium]
MTQINADRRRLRNFNYPHTISHGDELANVQMASSLHGRLMVSAANLAVSEALLSRVRILPMLKQWRLLALQFGGRLDDRFNFWDSLTWD